MISIIVCSVDDAKFENFKQSVEKAFNGEIQLIRIKYATSLAEGYNKGIVKATGNILVFCHDDIEFMNTNMSELLIDDLRAYDIVGVAGTSRLIDGSWISAGQPYVHGVVAHKSEENSGTYTLCSYGLGRDDCIVGGIQALDGLFFAANSEIIDHIKFDHVLFNGFHLYDLDFTFSSYLNGRSIVIDQRIHLIHQSGGRYDSVWKSYAEKFNRKYETVLPSNNKKQSNFILTRTSRSRQAVQDDMLNCLKGYRVFIDQLENDRQNHFSVLDYQNNVIDRSVFTRKDKLPFSDNSVNFVRNHCLKLNESNLVENITEILRICKSGAMVEVVGLADERMDLHNFPKRIRVQKRNRLCDYLVRQLDINAGGFQKRAFYQVLKNYPEC